MNLFSFKKQKNPVIRKKPKLFIFFVLILVIISIFPVFARPREAGAVETCDLTQLTKANAQGDFIFTPSDGRIPIPLDQVFQLGLKVTNIKDKTLSEACLNQQGLKIRVNLKLNLCSMSCSLPGATWVPFATGYMEGDSRAIGDGSGQAIGFGGLFQQKKIRDIIRKPDDGPILVSIGQDVRLYFYPEIVSSSTNKVLIPIGDSNGFYRTIAPANTPVITPEEIPSDWAPAVTGTTVNTSEPADYSKLGISIQPKANGAGLRSKYRVAWNDGDLNFDVTGGLEGVHMEWAPGAEQMMPPRQFLLPNKDNGWGWTNNPTYVGTTVYFGDAKTVGSVKKLACNPTWNDTSCSKLVFRAEDSSKKGDGATGQERLPGDFNPVLKVAGWRAGIPDPSQSVLKDGNGGKPLGQNEFVALPAIVGSSLVENPVITLSNILKHATVGSGVIVIAGSGELKKFTVEVYANEPDIIAACKADSEVADKAKCDNPAFARYGFASAISQTTNPDEAKAPSVKQTLYGFLIDLWSQITIIMTQIIYQIFAFFIVPVLTALLNVKPYQDAFVNIIYPGWLILRNLANIFFIIALLVVGLRILFQQSAASTARSFIMRLVIMALLVNFSLVIAQGVVGIADTVQSQFLPSGSEVVKALGTKLMVDPIQSFRTAVTNSETGTITSDSFSDLAKPMVLLMLAVAAFFAFIAIAAFLAVRLVALMLLYMVSPIAYVGYVMDESSGTASKWWHEFLRYAFMTPILVFFLNIAALVATATSSNIGNVITIGDSIADDLVMGGLTIITHFIVILILFAGMKFAMSFSAASSKSVTKKITDFAQNGFKKTFTKPLGWAGSAAKSAGMAGKDASGNALSGFLGKKGYKKSAALVSALTNPKLTKNELTDRLFTQPKAKQLKDLASRRAGLMEFASNVGNNKWQATKMAAWKLQGKDGEHFRDQAKDLRSIMTDEERVEAGKSLKDAKANLEEVERRKGSKDKNVTKEQAELYKNSLDNSIKATKKEKDTEINKLMDAKGAATAVGNKERVREIESKINDTQKGYTDRIAKLTKDRDDVDSRIKALPEGAGKNDLLQMADADSVGEVLRVNADKIDADIKDFKGKLENDTVLRKTYGFDGPIDEAKKDLIIKEAERLESIASKREFPQGAGEVAARIAKEHEEAKKFDGVDDIDNLKIALEEALRKNNIPSATALLKKLAKEGASASVLNEAGFNNNAEGLIDYMEEKLKNVSYAVRMQITSEFSDIAGKNGNRGLKNATSIDKDQVIRPNTLKQQEKKLENSSGKIPLTKRKIGDITYQDQNGKEIFIPGEFEDINDSSANAISKLGTKVAKHIWNTADKNGKVFRTEVQNALKRVANIS